MRETKKLPPVETLSDLLSGATLPADLRDRTIRLDLPLEGINADLDLVKLLTTKQQFYGTFEIHTSLAPYAEKITGLIEKYPDSNKYFLTSASDDLSPLTTHAIAKVSKLTSTSGGYSRVNAVPVYEKIQNDPWHGLKELSGEIVRIGRKKHGERHEDYDIVARIVSVKGEVGQRELTYEILEGAHKRRPSAPGISINIDHGHSISAQDETWREIKISEGKYQIKRIQRAGRVGVELEPEKLQPHQILSSIPVGASVELEATNTAYGKNKTEKHSATFLGVDHDRSTYLLFRTSEGIVYGYHPEEINYIKVTNNPDSGSYDDTAFFTVPNKLYSSDKI